MDEHKEDSQMDVDTLLTRQMELHTSVRHPPKTPQELVQLMDIMRNYKNYFESLRTTAEQFSVEPETVFQAFMYISVGGTVNFDRQHQDGSVPMHQAKVLTRSNAIELASTLRKELPNSELMVYVGLSRDLRTTLRVKVEDGNDLKTAEVSVREAVEYLNYIDRCAHHNAEQLFKFYMAEDPASLTALLNDSDPLSLTQTMSCSATRGSGMALPLPFDEGGADTRDPTPLPEPISSFLQQLKKQCGQASETSSVSGGAARRLKAAQIVLDWVTAVPAEYFSENAEKIVATVSSMLSLLATEKRSALCRVGCEIITILMQRLSPEPVFLNDVDSRSCSVNPETFSGALAQWTASLAKCTYVTVAAISMAADVALRAVSIQSHGHICVVKKLLEVLSNGTQTELRRKCLGYLSLCVAAADAHRPESVRELIPLLAPVAVNYVSIGDSPSRKMARALCSVLRVLAPNALPTRKDFLTIPDERIEHLVQQERPQVEPALLGGPQELEKLLFEADAFVSSMRSSVSSSSPRRSGMGSGSPNGSTGPRGRGRGTVTAGWQRLESSSPVHDNTGNASKGAGRARGTGQPPLAARTPAGSGTTAARHVGGELPRVPSPVRGQAAPQETKPIHPLGEVRSPTRRGPAAEPAVGPRRVLAGQRHRKSPRKAGAEKAVAAEAHKGQTSVNRDDGVYDTDSFLGSDPIPRKNAKAGEHHDLLPSTSTSIPAVHKSLERATPDCGRSNATSTAVDGHPCGSATHSSAPLLPVLSPHSRRGTVPVAQTYHKDTHELLPNNSGHCNMAMQPSADRPVPLSLRDGSDGRDDGEGDGAAPFKVAGVGVSSLSKQSSTEAVGGARISRTLRRKIEEKKPA